VPGFFPRRRPKTCKVSDTSLASGSLYLAFVRYALKLRFLSMFEGRTGHSTRSCGLQDPPERYRLERELPPGRLLGINSVEPRAVQSAHLPVHGRPHRNADVRKAVLLVKSHNQLSLLSFSFHLSASLPALFLLIPSVNFLFRCATSVQRQAKSGQTEKCNAL
jgi:hypothetical protein